MKKLIAILPLLCILSGEISSAGVVYYEGSSTPQFVFELSKSYSTSDSIIRVRPFHLDIVPPSSGVQFYRNGIIFLSYTKAEEKVPDKHLSFGALKTYMALVSDTVPGDYMPFLPSSSNIFPSEATTFTEDFNTMYLSLIPDRGNKEKIFMATLKSNNWVMEDQALNFCDGNYIYSHPSLSADGKFIYATAPNLGQTSLFAMIPSNSIRTRRPAYSAGSEKCFRYQPTPAGRKPPAPPVRFDAANGPSMLQSCGTSTVRHFESSKAAASAPGASPLQKRQSASKDATMRAFPDGRG